MATATPTPTDYGCRQRSTKPPGQDSEAVTTLKAEEPTWLDGLTCPCGAAVLPAQARGP